jgi:hypothetical protein
MPEATRDIPQLPSVRIDTTDTVLSWIRDARLPGPWRLRRPRTVADPAGGGRQVVSRVGNHIPFPTLRYLTGSDGHDLWYKSSDKHFEFGTRQPRERPN